MTKKAAVTIRLPAPVKRRPEKRAQRQARLLSAQVVHDLQAVTEGDPEQEVRGKFLGLYKGSPIPTEKDIKEVRSLLWKRKGRSGRNE